MADDKFDASTYVSKRVFDGVRPIPPGEAERLRELYRKYLLRHPELDTKDGDKE